MGIHGLTSFIDNNPHLLNDRQLHDCRVVIDGNNLFHFLYFYCNVRFQFGGDYDVFHRKICMIFAMFKECHVEAFVVFDGAYPVDGKKFKTTLNRARDRVYAAQRIMSGQRGVLIPCLAKHTFIQALDQLQIPHVTCDFEADNQMATLANQWKCPVISNDSDFYIFDLIGGFIPLDYIDFRPQRRSSESAQDGEAVSCLPVQFYHVDGFISSFKALKRSVLPLFATMLGNDYINAAAFEAFYQKTPKKAVRNHSSGKKHHKIMSVLHWLEDKHHEGELVTEVLSFIRLERREQVHRLLTSSIAGYLETHTFESFNLRAYLEGDGEAVMEKGQEVRGARGQTLPAWFMAAGRRGQLSAFLLNAALLHTVVLPTQVESTFFSASFVVSRPIREVMYGLLLGAQHNADTAADDLTQSGQTGPDGKNVQASADLSGSSCSSGGVHTESTNSSSDEHTQSIDSSSDVHTRSTDSSSGVHTATSTTASEGRESSTDTVGKSDTLATGQGVAKESSHTDTTSSLQTDTDLHPESQAESVISEPQTQKQAQTDTESGIVEYTRHNMELRRIVVAPRTSLPSFGTLPSLATLPSVDQGKRTAIMTETLGVTPEFLNKFSPGLQLFAGCLVYWVRSATPSVSIPILKGVLVSAVLLQVHREIGDREAEMMQQCTGEKRQQQECGEESEEQQSVDSTKVQSSRDGFTVSETDTRLSDLSETLSNGARDGVNVRNTDTAVTCNLERGACSSGTGDSLDTISIARTCHAESDKVLAKVRDNLKKYYHDPVKTCQRKNPPVKEVFHGMAQLSACLLDTILLNSLLSCPLPTPIPAHLLNGSFVYRIIHELQERSNPELFLCEMLVKGSSLLSLLDRLLGTVVGEVGVEAFTGHLSQGRKRCKGAKKRKKQQSGSAREETGGDVDSKGKPDLAEGDLCDLNNRFGALLMDDGS